MEKPRVIFVDDEKVLMDTYELLLPNAYGANRSFSFEFYSTPVEALAEIKKNPFNVALVFLDHHFRNDPENLVLGSSYIKEIKKISSYIEVVMMSADSSNESLRLWLKNGADKFIYKDNEDNLGKIQIFINEALTNYHAKFGKLLGSKKDSTFSIPESIRKLEMVSVSTQMETIAELVLQCAKSDLSALLIGDTGTGKELVARAIHNNSSRSKNEFRTIDCTQFKLSHIIQSELFGSEKGAFTGAESKIGLIEAANGGTVFLDEAHHLGSEAQAMLLRFLQDKTVRRVGGKTETKVNVRFVFAAKPILKEMVQKNEFLPDLYYRMKEVRIDLPNLISRDGDLEALSYHFLDRENARNGSEKRLHPDTLELFRSYQWPGNVRELENLMKRLCVLVPDVVILPEHVIKFGELEIDSSKIGMHEISTFAELERRHKKEKIELILKAYGMGEYSRAKAARLLDIPRTSLRNIIKALGINELMESAQEDEGSSSSKNALKNSWKLVSAYLDN